MGWGGGGNNQCWALVVSFYFYIVKNAISFSFLPGDFDLGWVIRISLAQKYIIFIVKIIW